MTEQTIIQGDVRESLKNIPSESVDCVITSPPYWALRDYGVEGQLGLEPTFEEFITKLCDTFDQIKRVLKKTGTCWVNLGDTYYSVGTKGSSDGRAGFTEQPKDKYEHSIGTGKCLICGTPTNKQFCSMRCLNTKGNDFRSQFRQLPSKSLCLIPERFAIEMVNRGWILRNTMIWYKRNCMPSSAKDRFTVDFEKIFFFVKDKKYWFEQQFEKHSQGRNKRCVWDITTQPFPEAHFAVYPEKLVETPLKAGCPPKGMVLDPFMGSGTTLVVARKLGYNAIGIEIKKEYCDIARKRLNKLPVPLSRFSAKTDKGGKG